MEGAISIFWRSAVALAIWRSRPASRAEAIVKLPMLDGVLPPSAGFLYRIDLFRGRFASPSIGRKWRGLLMLYAGLAGATCWRR